MATLEDYIKNLRKEKQSELTVSDTLGVLNEFGVDITGADEEGENDN